MSVYTDPVTGQTHDFVGLSWHCAIHQTSCNPCPQITVDQLLTLAARDVSLGDDAFRMLAAAASGPIVYSNDAEPHPYDTSDDCWPDFTVCEAGCGRALPVEEAEHAQCGSLLVYCSDCLAGHAQTCLVCGAE